MKPVGADLLSSAGPAVLLEHPRDSDLPTGSEQGGKAEPSTGGRRSKTKRGRPRDKNFIPSGAPSSSGGAAVTLPAGISSGSAPHVGEPGLTLVTPSIGV